MIAHSRPATAADAVRWLRSASAVRARCNSVFEGCRRGGLDHFMLDERRFDAAADCVIETMRAAYGEFDIPLHSRWRHFSVGGVDRWGQLRARLGDASRDEVARTAIELAVVSVLLDAGAGPLWRYKEPATGATFARSEGLAIATFHLFASGVLSARPGAIRADAATLVTIDAARLAQAFQAGPDNPLLGIEGRAAILNRLGRAAASAPLLFGDEARIGNLYDALRGRAAGGRLEAATILATLLEALESLWPSSRCLDGRPLGDVWFHPAARTDDATDGLVPLHKLTQWLSYSLIEPLEEAGIGVTKLDALTGLAEYRNGGLFIDLGVLVPRHGRVLGSVHGVDSEIVVEWRALTVTCLDQVATRIRARLGLDAERLPLARILEGGTWRAGRRIAAALRPDGTPPIRVASDGTLF